MDNEMLRLAENLKYLMDLHGYKGQQQLHRASIQRGSKVSQAKIGNILNRTQQTSLGVIARLAKVFGVQTWQMLAPPHLLQHGITPELDKLIADYAVSDAEARDTIARVADTHARLVQRH